MIDSIALVTGEKVGYYLSVDFTNKKERGKLNKKFKNWLKDKEVKYDQFYSEYDLKEMGYTNDDLNPEQIRNTKRYSSNFTFKTNEERRSFHYYVREVRDGK